MYRKHCFTFLEDEFTCYSSGAVALVIFSGVDCVGTAISSVSFSVEFPDDNFCAKIGFDSGMSNYAVVIFALPLDVFGFDQKDLAYILRTFALAGWFTSDSSEEADTVDKSTLDNINTDFVFFLCECPA